MRGRLRIIVAVVITAASLTAWAPVASAKAMTPKQLARAIIRAKNAGDVDAVMALISPNAVYTNAACGMSASKCRGLRAIRAIEQNDAGNHLHLSISHLMTDGNKVWGNWRGSADDIKTIAGVHRVVGTFAMWFTNSKLSHLDASLDLSDKQTAMFAKAVGM